MTSSDATPSAQAIGTRAQSANFSRLYGADAHASTIVFVHDHLVDDQPNPVPFLQYIEHMRFPHADRFAGGMAASFAS